MKNTFVLCLFSILIFSKSFSRNLNNYFSEPNSGPSNSKRHDTTHLGVRAFLHHISDINFREQEYKIELWLYVTSKKSLKSLDSLEYQFIVAGAKELSGSVIPQYNSRKVWDQVWQDSVYRKLVRLNCTMSQNWHLDNYPFDRQNLNLLIYTVRSKEWLQFDLLKSDIGFTDNGEIITNAIEHGWSVNTGSIIVDTATHKGIINSNNEYPAIKISIPMSRTENFALFIKLFIGMYVSFFVAFLAFFINLNHADSKFGLTVGGLFAAIGNKYIMESILPQTSGLTIVDTLHTSTIVSILLIILFSALSLYRSEKNELKNRKQQILAWMDKTSWLFILVLYLCLNIWCIVWGMTHHAS